MLRINPNNDVKMQMKFANYRDRRHVPLAQLHSAKSAFLFISRSSECEAIKQKYFCLFSDSPCSRRPSRNEYFWAIRRSETLLMGSRKLFLFHFFTTSDCFPIHVLPETRSTCSLSERIQGQLYQLKSSLLSVAQS